MIDIDKLDNPPLKRIVYTVYVQQLFSYSVADPFYSSVPTTLAINGFVRLDTVQNLNLTNFMSMQFVEASIQIKIKLFVNMCTYSILNITE